MDITLANKLWNSPTFMTWGNLAAKSSNLVILLPIVLTTFSNEDIVVWYLYFTIVSLQLIIDFGFMPTFTRLFSYAYSGLNVDELKEIRQNRNANGRINWESLSCLFVSTKKIYLRLSIVTLLFALTIGSWLVYEPISESSNALESWVGWGIVVSIASFSLYANSFVALLQGMDKVALVQRWQMVSSLLSVTFSALFILIFKSLLVGISVFYFWYIVNFCINFFLVKKHYYQDKTSTTDRTINNLIKETIWPTAWRSGLGLAMSMGLIQLSGMIVAKIETAVVSASYLIALQMIRAISSFSQAPFYSRIPFFSQLYSRNEISLLLEISKNRMQKSFFVFIGMFVSVGLFADTILSTIESNAKFPDKNMWILIGIAFLFERFGAMYLQLYTLTNHIIWHIANGVSGIIMILVVVFTHSFMGVYAFPLAMCSGYLLFYVPYVVSKTYLEYELNIINQEKSNFFLAILLFSVSCLLIFNIN